MFQKICNKCLNTKFVEEFYKQKLGKYGVTGECKECRKDRAAINRSLTREKKNIVNKEWYKSNKVKKKLSNREWRSKNKDYMKIYRSKIKLAECS